MQHTSEPRGWQLHHKEQLFFKASTGAPTIQLKFFHYPPYRQTVEINQSPAQCKLKIKKNNAYFLFHQQVRTKGIISLERIISVFPIPSTVSLNDDWGNISDISRLLQKKYKQSSQYWPMNSPLIRDVSQERWFATEDLSSWIQTASRYIIEKIKYPEKQEKRLGADQAVLTGIGDCDEFTDLFITLARLRGIPCRRLTGYYIHQSNTEPEPHAWAELFSPVIGWIPIDIALRNLGKHTIQYVIGKIEEFTPSLLDYHIQKQSAAVQYHWERPAPLLTPID
jgi:hypothetical protein